jgi:hypothetical protein
MERIPFQGQRPQDYSLHAIFNLHKPHGVSQIHLSDIREDSDILIGSRQRESHADDGHASTVTSGLVEHLNGKNQ